MGPALTGTTVGTSGEKDSEPAHHMQQAGFKRAGEALAEDWPSAKRQQLPAAGAVVYRVLAANAHIGSVIGKGGQGIQRLRQDTGVRIKVEPLVAGCSDRVITLSSPDSPPEEHCPAQHALFRIQRQLQEAPLPAAAHCHNADSAGQECSTSNTARLLVDSAQVGCLLGKGGAIIEGLRRRSGAGIRVLGRQDTPLCGAPGDSVVVVSGSRERVEQALEQISAQLRVNPSRQAPSPSGPRTTNIAATAFNNGLLAGPLAGLGLPHHGSMALNPIAALATHLASGSSPHSQQAGGERLELGYRLLVPAERTGAIIGRCGDTIRHIRADTGARVKVHDATPGSEERVVSFSSSGEAGALVQGAQEALLRCVACVLADDPRQGSHTVRLLVPTPQAGAVLGRGGSTMAQLRQETGTQVRVLPHSSSPPPSAPQSPASIASGASAPHSCASAPAAAAGGDDEEVVQVEGTALACIAALRIIAQLLRGWQARHPAVPPQRRQVQSLPASPSLLWEQERMASLGSASSHPHSSLSRHSSGAEAASLLATHAGRYVEPAYGSLQAQAQLAGEGSVRLTLQLSQEQAGAVLGKCGANISQIRQQSGAAVKLHNRQAGGGRGRELHLAGAPRQVAAAQALVQAFLLTGNAPPLAPHPLHAF